MNQFGLGAELAWSGPCKSRMVPGLCFSGGREIWVRGQNLDVVQMPRIRVTVVPRVLQHGPGPGQKHHAVPEKVCGSRAVVQ